jgi:hypothetical protein
MIEQGNTVKIHYTGKLEMDKSKYRIITTTNESKTYIDFWPTVARSWKRLGFDNITLGFITNRSSDDKMVEKMRKYGDVKIFNPIKDIPTGNQAKATRMYLASEYTDDYCILADIDMYLLNQKLSDGWFSRVTDSNLLAIAPNAYYNTPQEGKFPMYYTTAKGSTYKEFVNPKNLEYEDIFNSWSGLNIFDNKESIKNPFDRYSDESMMRALISKWDRKSDILYIERDDFKRMRASKRIDRSNWNIDMDKLKNNEYIDSNPLRPLSDNLDKVKPILNYLGIPKEDWLI